MKKTLSIFLSCVMIAACGKKDDDSKASVVAAGSYSVRGIVTITSADCQTNVATLTLTSVSGGQSYSTVQVQNNGSFNINVSAGSYILRAQAGNCSVAGEVRSQNASDPNYTVCLGSACQMAKTTVGFFKAVPADQEVAQGVPCAWNYYGCSGTAYPGTGLVVVSDARISFSAKSASDVSLALQFASGNNLLTAVPAHDTKGWQAKVGTDGKLQIEKNTEDDLSYGAQVDDKALQFTDGFCDGREQILGRMADYLNASGFSEGAIQRMKNRWADHLPRNPTLCAYPQKEEQISKAITYKTSPTVEANRLWFILIPQVDEAYLKVKPAPKNMVAYIQKPKTDALAAAKKSPKQRKVANETAGLAAEECGVGFVIEK